MTSCRRSCCNTLHFAKKIKRVSFVASSFRLFVFVGAFFPIRFCSADCFFCIPVICFYICMAKIEKLLLGSYAALFSFHT